MFNKNTTSFLALFVVVFAATASCFRTRGQQFEGATVFRKRKTDPIPVKPAILIPGILGTQLNARLNKTTTPSRFCYKKSDWFSIWLNLELFLPKVIECWVDNIRVLYHSKTNCTSNDGVEIIAPNFGSTEFIEYLDTNHYNPGSPYFSGMVNYMVKELGYVKKENLFGAPYDWRFAIYQSENFFKNLTSLIEKAYEKNKQEKVVLIAHSMGNLFTSYMLRHKSQLWKDKYIDSFISISGPYLGAVKSLKALIAGDSEGHSWILPGPELRQAIRTMPSSVMMLPNRDLWPMDKRDIMSIKLKNGTVETWTIDQYEDVFRRAKCDNCYEMWKENNDTMNDMAPPSVHVHCVYGTQKETMEKITFNEGDFPDGEPTYELGDGDGTVNIWSGSACMKWKMKQKQPVNRVEMKGNDHVGILFNQTMFEYIKHVVQIN